jgi:hypothetical protein
MHWEKASALAGAELLGEPGPLADDPTRATAGPGEPCEQAVASSATAINPTANLLMCRSWHASMPASLAAGPPRRIPQWW